jgi:hypothetical protein
MNLETHGKSDRLTNLPTEIIRQVLTSTSPRKIVSMQRVCRRFRDIIVSDKITMSCLRNIKSMTDAAATKYHLPSAYGAIGALRKDFPSSRQSLLLYRDLDARNVYLESGDIRNKPLFNRALRSGLEGATFKHHTCDSLLSYMRSIRRDTYRFYGLVLPVAYGLGVGLLGSISFLLASAYAGAAINATSLLAVGCGLAATGTIIGFFWAGLVAYGSYRNTKTILRDRIDRYANEDLNFLSCKQQRALDGAVHDMVSIKYNRHDLRQYAVDAKLHKRSPEALSRVPNLPHIDIPDSELLFHSSSHLRDGHWTNSIL